ncbi:MAG: hypothetical protein ACK56F_22960, partial [bacterium]
MVPLRNKEAETVAQGFWKHFVVHYGFPSIVQTDRGKEFTSELATAFFTAASDKMLSTAVHPQSQGVVERFNRKLSDALAKLVGTRQWEWVDY